MCSFSHSSKGRFQSHSDADHRHKLFAMKGDEGKAWAAGYDHYAEKLWE